MNLNPNQQNYTVKELQNLTRVPFEVLPNSPAVYSHFAQSIADEIQKNNQANKPTKLILPVGPIGQYPILVEICNRETHQLEECVYL